MGGGPRGPGSQPPPVTEPLNINIGDPGIRAPDPPQSLNPNTILGGTQGSGLLIPPSH